MPHRIAILLLAALCAACVSAAELSAEAESKSYLPLIPESTYTYNAIYKEIKSSETLIVKSENHAGEELFYFIPEKDLNNPGAAIGTSSFGLGLLVREPGGIATMTCFFKSNLNSVNAASLARRVTILKNPPEAGQSAEIPDADGSFKRTFRVEGKEDVTVSAGTFKDCIKIKTQEIQVRKPPLENIVASGTVWLAKGVGVVKWVRATGRVDELSAYKLAEIKK